MSNDNTSVVYFAKNQATGEVKIGFSTNVKQRLTQLRNGNHSEIEIIRIVQGGRETERAYHEMFADKRLKREWFAFDESMLTANVTVTEPARPPEPKRPEISAILFALGEGIRGIDAATKSERDGVIHRYRLSFGPDGRILRRERDGADF